MTLGARSLQAYQDATCGIIFLGSPHLVTTSVYGWSVVRLLMKANRRDVSKQNMTEYEMESVLSACRQFEELQLNFPILSVYETQDTKFKETIFQTVRQKDDSTKVVRGSSMILAKMFHNVANRAVACLPSHDLDPCTQGDVACSSQNAYRACRY